LAGNGKGARSINRALFFVVAPTQVPRSGTGELVTAVFTASEPKLDAGFQVTGKGNGTAIFAQRGMVLMGRGMGLVLAPLSGSTIAGSVDNGCTAVGAALRF